LAGFTVFLLASLAASVAPNLSVLVVCRLLQAAGVSVATVVTRAIVRDTLDAEDGAVVLAFISMVMGVAPILAPLVGGIIISGFDWHAVFLAHAFIAALLLAWMTRSLSETRARAVAAAPLRQFSTGVALLTQDRAFVGYTLGYACVSAATFLFVTVGAEIFATRYGIDAATFGLLWSALAIAYAGGSYAAARLTRRHGSQLTIRWATRTHAIGGLLVLGVSAWIAAPLVAFCLALMILMGSAGMASPLALAGAVAGRADVAGLASGVSSAIAMFFSMLAAITAGVAFDGTALSVAWFIPPACLAGWYAVNMALRHHVDRR
jgi:DHA1 family bicyclomycin/chloramphenicol resistance-like MFS transporter